MYFLLLIIAFVVGFFLGKPLFPYVNPRSPITIVVAMLPFFFLYFFSENHLINQIRYGYLLFAIGIFTSWTWEQIKAQLPK